jgi:hypothetical protein
MNPRIGLYVLAAGFSCCGCGHREGPAAVGSVQEQPPRVAGTGVSPQRPDRIIVTLRLRDALIEVHTGPAGRRFTLKDGDGKLIASDLTSEDLQKRHPGHFEALERGLARGAEGSLDSSLDARLWEAERDPGPITIDLTR